MQPWFFVVLICALLGLLLPLYTSYSCRQIEYITAVTYRYRHCVSHTSHILDTGIMLYLSCYLDTDYSSILLSATHALLQYSTLTQRHSCSYRCRYLSEHEHACTKTCLHVSLHMYSTAHTVFTYASDILYLTS